MPLVLYDNAFSPYAFKVRATLYEKDIAHEKHEMRYASDRAALLAVNPRGEVPALSDGDALIYDSSVICEYLETRYPKPALLPRDPAGQARCRLFEKLADGPFDACIIALAVLQMMKPELGKSHPRALEQAKAELLRMYAHLDEQLRDRDFLCGDFSRADLALAPHFVGASFLGHPPEQPALAAWHERVTARPSIVRATAEFMAAFQHGREDEDPFFSSAEMHVRDHRIEWLLRIGLGGWLAEEKEAGRLAFSAPT